MFHLRISALSVDLRDGLKLLNLHQQQLHICEQCLCLLLHY